VPNNRLTREQLVQRAALELPDGAYVNLGFGLPNLVSSHVPPGRTIYFHSENGILGMGPRARKGKEDPDLVDAMKVHVTLNQGAAFFSQLEAHMMTRGGHLDVALLGALQVSERGDLANWKVPGTGGAGGIGGAMDIAVGSPRIVVLMEHVTKEGEPKIVKRCSYPLTALECVHRIITDMAVIDVAPDGLVLREVGPGVTPQEVQDLTEPVLTYSGQVPEMQFPCEKASR
jgi:3-oxoacid CoA-transferase subunit B